MTYEDSTISQNNHSKWVSGSVRLFSLKSSSQGPLGTTSVRLDGDLNRKALHAIAISNAAIRSRIPTYLSHQGQPGNFYLDDATMKNGKFRRLINELPDADKSRLHAICSYIYNNRDLILSELKKTTNTKRKEFWSGFNRDYEIKRLAGNCLRGMGKKAASLQEITEVKTVSNNIQKCKFKHPNNYIRSAQTKLSSLGYYTSSIDGIFGNNTKSAYIEFENFLGDEIANADGCLDDNEILWLKIIEKAKQEGLECDKPVFESQAIFSARDFLKKYEYFDGDFPTTQLDKRTFTEGIIRMEVEGKLHGDDFSKNCKLDKNDVEIILAKIDAEKDETVENVQDASKADLFNTGATLSTEDNRPSWCSKAKTLVEIVICNDRELSNLDVLMGEIWRIGIEKRYIDEQRKWLRKLNSCIDRECLKIKYNERITVLKSHQEKNLEKNIKQLMKALEIEKAQVIQWQDRYKNALIDKNGKEHRSVDDAISSNDEAVKTKALTAQDGVTYESADSLKEIVKYEALTDQHGVTFKSINSAITSNDGEIKRKALTAKDGSVFESIDAAMEIQASKLRAEMSSNQSNIKTESELKENILIEPDVCDPHFEAKIKTDSFGNFKYHYYIIGFNIGYTLTNNMQVPIRFKYMKDNYSKKLEFLYNNRMLGPGAVMQPGDFVSAGTFRPFAIYRNSIEELSETDLGELKVEYGCTVENFRNQTIKIKKRDIKIEFPPESGIKDWRPFVEITPQSTKFEGLKFMLE